MRHRGRILALVAAGSVAAVLIPIVTKSTGALFNTSTSAAASVTSKRIFPGNRTVIAHDLRDGSTGTLANGSDAIAQAGDGLTFTTGSWATTFSTSSYEEADFDAPNPGGIVTTAATLNLTFADGRGQTGDQTCFYFDLRRISTGAVLGTFGSAAAPVACENVGTLKATSTSILASVPSTDIANDVRARLYFNQSKGGWPAVIDLLSLTVTTPYVALTQNAGRLVDQGTVTSWPLGTAADGVTFTSAANWPTTYTSTKYLQWTFPASAPAGAVVTGATLRHSYHGNSTATLCNYFEVWSGGTLLGAHGGTPNTNVSCTTSATTNTDDSVALPEINTVALANSAVIKMYYKASTSDRSMDDLVALDVNYYLD